MSPDHEQNQYVDIDDIPPPDENAPCPHLVAKSGYLAIAYYVDPGSYDGEWKVISLGANHAEIAVITFQSAPIHALATLPFDYRMGSNVYEVLNSDWRRERREPEVESKRHIQFAFRDATFDCLCDSYLVEVFDGHMSAVVELMTARMGA